MQISYEMVSNAHVRQLTLSFDNALKYKFPCFLKVIPQKLKLLMNFFETFPECSLPSTVSKNTRKMIGHHSRLRDVMGQSYLICACTRTNHARYSPGPSYILR